MNVPSNNDLNRPAFPKGRPTGDSSGRGLTVREYASVHLDVRNTDHPWMDVMIEQALWQLDARAALTAIASIPANLGAAPAVLATRAGEIADAMEAERNTRYPL